MSANTEPTKFQIQIVTDNFDPTMIWLQVTHNSRSWQTISFQDVSQIKLAIEKMQEYLAQHKKGYDNGR